MQCREDRNHAQVLPRQAGYRRAGGGGPRCVSDHSAMDRDSPSLPVVGHMPTLDGSDELGHDEKAAFAGKQFDPGVRNFRPA